MSTELSAARRKLTLARKRYIEVDAFTGSLPTEGFNAEKALTPALEKRGRAQRAVWKAEEELKRLEAAESFVCKRQVQIDRSGQGHNWRDISPQDIPASVREEIEGEMIDGGCELVASNGQHYRW